MGCRREVRNRMNANLSPGGSLDERVRLLVHFISLSARTFALPPSERGSHHVFSRHHSRDKCPPGPGVIILLF